MKQEDGLMHFCWKSLDSTPIEPLDLIIFSGDAHFGPIPQTDSKQIYVLRFSSSSARHFFWLQDDSDLDRQKADHINTLIDDPYATFTPRSSASETDVPMGDTTLGSQPEVQLNSQDQLRTLLRQFNDIQTPAIDRSLSLTDILVPTETVHFITSACPDPDRLWQHLPPSVAHDKSTLTMAITSPEFRRALSMFTMALSTGGLAPLMSTFQLPPSAANSVEAFLEAIKEQAKAADASMDQDHP